MKRNLKHLIKKEYIYMFVAALLGAILAILPFYNDPEPSLYAVSSDQDGIHCLFPAPAKNDQIIGLGYPFLAKDKISVYTIETANFIIEIHVIDVITDDPFIAQTFYNLTKNNLPNGIVIIKDQPDDFEILLPDKLGYMRGKIIVKNRKVYRFYSFSNTESDLANKYIQACVDVIRESPVSSESEISLGETALISFSKYGTYFSSL